MKLTLPTDSTVRKDIPLYSGCYTYFPAALAGVAMHSKINNEKHNPGEPLHHSRGKSSDHADCIARHSMDLADMLARKVVWTAEEKAAILTESRALSWRSLAWAQEIEEMFGAPLAPAARLPQNNINVLLPTPAKERSGSFASGLTQPQCGQTLAPNRAWSHDPSQDQVAAEKGHGDLYRRV